MDYCLFCVSIRHKSRMIINKFCMGSFCFKICLTELQGVWRDMHVAFRLSVKCVEVRGSGQLGGHLERITNIAISVSPSTFHILFIS